jgi:hypothetical protein
MYILCMIVFNMLFCCILFYDCNFKSIIRNSAVFYFITSTFNFIMLTILDDFYIHWSVTKLDLWNVNKEWMNECVIQHRIRSYFSIIHQTLITSTNVSHKTVNECILCYMFSFYTRHFWRAHRCKFYVKLELHWTIMKPIRLTTFSVANVIKMFSNSGNETHRQTGMLTPTHTCTICTVQIIYAFCLCWHQVPALHRPTEVSRLLN